MTETISINLFPTLIRYTENFLNKIQCNEIKKYILKQKDKTYTHELLTGDSKSSYYIDSYISKEIGKLKHCEEIIKNLQIKIKDYSLKSGIGKENIDINDCWFNVQQKGSQLIKHTHPNATLSGALYINVDNNSSPIYFYNPVGFLDYTYIKEYTDYTFNWFKFNPNPGDLIIWPSWLSHGSNTNINETDDRIVISFNAL